MKTIKLKEIINNEDGFWNNKIVELKKWNLDEILAVKIIEGSTPAYGLEDAGFIFEEKIDVKELFGDYLEKDVHDASRISIVSNTPDGIQRRPWTSSKGKRNLKSVKSKLEKILEKLDYRNRDLIIFRTFKGGYPTNWDSIWVFSEKLEDKNG